MNKKANDINSLILSHLDMVKIIAQKVMIKLPVSMELDDIIHSGVIGLIDAAHKYIPEKGVKFSTYASTRIRGAIIDELRNKDWASRNLRKKIKDLETLYEKLEMKLGRTPTSDEVAKELGVSLDEYHSILANSKGVALGVYRYDGNEQNLESGDLLTLNDMADNSPVATLEREEMKKLLLKFINELKDREKMVLQLHYVEELNLKEVGKILSLSESRISQIKTEAILKIRSKIKLNAQKNNVRENELL